MFRKNFATESLPVTEGDDGGAEERNFANATHDVGIVWGPNGPYIIAVLSDQPWKPEPIAEL